MHAITDVTGFGLAGHGLEMARGAGLSVRIDWARVPLLPGVVELAAQGFVTGASGHQLGRLWRRCGAGRGPAVRPRPWRATHETSGGLLVACAPDSVDEVLALFAREGFARAAVIGGVEAGPARLELR